MEFQIGLASLSGRSKASSDGSQSGSEENGVSLFKKNTIEANEKVWEMDKRRGAGPGIVTTFGVLAGPYLVQLLKQRKRSKRNPNGRRKGTVLSASISSASWNAPTRTWKESDLTKVCIVVDLELFNLSTEWVHQRVCGWTVNCFLRLGSQNDIWGPRNVNTSSAFRV